MLEMAGVPAVFLDRDGVINRDKGFIIDPDDLDLLPGAAESMKRLRTAGFKLIVVTNQSGIGQGLYTETDLAGVHDRLEALLAAEGVHVEGIYFAPDHPERPTARRKPGPGMLLEAAEAHGIALRDSAMVGDQVRDAEAGMNAGCVLNILVPPGAGDPRFPAAPDLAGATAMILNILGTSAGKIV